MINEFRDVFASLTQAWYAHQNHSKPMIEILPELGFCDEREQIATGRGDDPHVNFHLFRSADPLECLVEQHA